VPAKQAISNVRSLEMQPAKASIVEPSKKLEESTSLSKLYVNDAFDEAYAAISNKLPNERAARANAEAPQQQDRMLIRLESIDQVNNNEVNKEVPSNSQSIKLKQKIYALDELVATEKDFLAEMSTCYEAFMTDKSNAVSNEKCFI
jgi:hypothetical protein